MWPVTSARALSITGIPPLCSSWSIQRSRTALWILYRHPRSPFPPVYLSSPARKALEWRNTSCLASALLTCATQNLSFAPFFLSGVLCGQKYRNRGRLVCSPETPTCGESRRGGGGEDCQGLGRGGDNVQTVLWDLIHRRGQILRTQTIFTRFGSLKRPLNDKIDNAGGVLRHHATASRAATPPPPLNPLALPQCGSTPRNPRARHCACQTNAPKTAPAKQSSRLWGLWVWEWGAMDRG